MASKKRSHSLIDENLLMRQSSAVACLLEKHGVAVSGGTSSLSTTSISFPSVQLSLHDDWGRKHFNHVILL